LAVIVAVAFLTFSNGGYRAMAAVIFALAAGIPVGAASRAVPLRALVAAAVAGALVAVGPVAFAMQFPKGPYVLYSLLLTVTAILVLASRGPNKQALTATGVACFAALAPCSAGIALYWG